MRALLLSGRVLRHLTLEVALREDDFYREQHGLLYAAVCPLFHAG
jgi:replicative DNA helicase